MKPKLPNFEIDYVFLINFVLNIDKSLWIMPCVCFLYLPFQTCNCFSRFFLSRDTSFIIMLHAHVSHVGLLQKGCIFFFHLEVNFKLLPKRKYNKS